MLYGQEYFNTVDYGSVLITKVPRTIFDLYVATLDATDGAEFEIYQVPEGYLVAYELPENLR